MNPVLIDIFLDGDDLALIEEGLRRHNAAMRQHGEAELPMGEYIRTLAKIGLMERAKLDAEQPDQGGNP